MTISSKAHKQLALEQSTYISLRLVVLTSTTFDGIGERPRPRLLCCMGMWPSQWCYHTEVRPNKDAATWRRWQRGDSGHNNGGNSNCPRSLRQFLHIFLSTHSMTVTDLFFFFFPFPNPRLMVQFVEIWFIAQIRNIIILSFFL